MFKKITSLFLAVLWVTLLLPSHINIVWAENSGSCGDSGENVKWQLDGDGTLTITGNGGMTQDTAPWDDSKDKITSVSIGEGVTSIGKLAFWNCDKLTSVDIPSSVTRIGAGAFINCSKLENVTYRGTNEPDLYEKEQSADGATDIFADNPKLTVKVPCNYKSEKFLTKVINKIHDLTHYEAKAATCQEKGNIEYWHCSRCGKNFSNAAGTKEVEPVEMEIDSTNHVNTEIKDAKEATCTEDGYTGDTYCSDCGEKICDGEVISKTGHSYSEWEITKPATCTEKGIEERVCEKCGAKEERDITALGHNYVETVVAPTKKELGGTKHKCSRCGDEYWDNFTKDDTYAQTVMPNGETVYHYCTHNGLSAETTVDVGDGQTLKVFLQDPLQTLKTNENQVLSPSVNYIPENSERYNNLMSKLDKKYDIEHIKFFDVYPTIDKKPITGKLEKSVYMGYEIPEDWDEDDLEIVLVQDGDDQEFDETVLEIDSKKCLATWKNHFSPYAIIDKRSESEKEAANKNPSTDTPTDNKTNTDTSTNTSKNPTSSTPSSSTSLSESESEINRFDDLLAVLEESDDDDDEGIISPNSIKTGEQNAVILASLILIALASLLYLIYYKKKAMNEDK